MIVLTQRLKSAIAVNNFFFMQEILHYLDNENRMGRYFFVKNNKALQQFILSEAILDFEQWTLNLRLGVLIEGLKSTLYHQVLPVHRLLFKVHPF